MAAHGSLINYVKQLKATSSMSCKLSRWTNAVAEPNLSMPHEPNIVQNTHTFDESFPATTQSVNFEQVLRITTNDLVGIGMHKLDEICATTSMFTKNDTKITFFVTLYLRLSRITWC